MDDQKIRRIVQEELQRKLNQDRFGYSTIPYHIHNGKDSPNVPEENVSPNASIVGTIEMSTEGAVYTLNLNSQFTPRSITAYGVVTGTYSAETIRAITVGSAQLTPAFYFQPSSSRSVTTSNKEYPFPTLQPDGTTPSVPAQSSAYLLTSRISNANTFALTSENHIVSVSGFGSTGQGPNNNIYARATVIGFSKSSVEVYVPYLSSGWTIFLTYIIS